MEVVGGVGCDTKVEVLFGGSTVATRGVVLWLVVTSLKLGEIGRDVDDFLHVLWHEWVLLSTPKICIIFT